MSLVQPAVYFRALFLCLSVADQSEALKLVTLVEGKKFQVRKISFLCFFIRKSIAEKKKNGKLRDFCIESPEN